MVDFRTPIRQSAGWNPSRRDENRALETVSSRRRSTQDLAPRRRLERKREGRGVVLVNSQKKPLDKREANPRARYGKEAAHEVVEPAPVFACFSCVFPLSRGSEAGADGEGGDGAHACHPESLGPIFARP
ncbi:hypothetical protein MTO96_011827 [Rhipicephalus appendiculatus]